MNIEVEIGAMWSQLESQKPPEDMSQVAGFYVRASEVSVVKSTLSFPPISTDFILLVFENKFILCEVTKFIVIIFSSHKEKYTLP